MSSREHADKPLAFEEYCMYYESTEKVTDRRLAANQWNYAICSAVLVAVAAAFDWGLRRPPLLLVTLAGILALAVMAVLYCSLWIGQLRDFKALNNAKFTVLNEMAPRVRFSDSPGDSRISRTPFSREWQILEKSNSLTKIQDDSLVALKASNIEYLIPKAFRILFVGIVLVAIAVGIRSSAHRQSGSVLGAPRDSSHSTSTTVSP